jgi:hypothetical protein
MCQRENPWDWIKKLLERVGNHYPVDDIDSDHFSSTGLSWILISCADLF